MRAFKIMYSTAILSTILIIIQALECGFSRGEKYDEFRKISFECIHQNDTKNLSNSDSSEESDESSYATTTSSYGGSLLGKSRRQRSTYNPCILQCVFQQFNLTDDKGYPEHDRVVDALLRTARGRELRDFLQDTTDECFQIVNQGEKVDSCEHSAQLVNCLADRGRTNCVDWPNGNLPIQFK